MDEARAQRLAMNEVLFRDLNDELLLQKGRPESEPPSFLCECARVSCQLRISVDVAEYKTTRAHPHRFLIYPGHEQSEIEVVVGGSPPRYVEVEKIGPGKDVAGA